MTASVTAETVADALAAARALAPDAEQRVLRGIAMTMVHHHESAAAAVRRMRSTGWAKEYPETFARLAGVDTCAS